MGICDSGFESPLTFCKQADEVDSVDTDTLISHQRATPTATTQPHTETKTHPYIEYDTGQESRDARVYGTGTGEPRQPVVRIYGYNSSEHRLSLIHMQSKNKEHLKQVIRDTYDRPDDDAPTNVVTSSSRQEADVYHDDDDDDDDYVSPDPIVKTVNLLRDKTKTVWNEDDLNTTYEDMMQELQHLSGQDQTVEYETDEFILGSDDEMHTHVEKEKEQMVAHLAHLMHQNSIPSGDIS